MTETDVPARAGKAVRAIAAAHDITLEQIIIYGSYAQNEATERSDIDIVLVSPDWEGINYYMRPEAFLLDWPREDLPTPDIIPLTPEELNRRAHSDADIVRTAVETGVSAR